MRWHNLELLLFNQEISGSWQVHHSLHVAPVESSLGSEWITFLASILDGLTDLVTWQQVM